MEDIQGTLKGFLRAFSELKLDEMMAYYADDATSFFPIRHHSPRLDGKEAIREAFARVLSKVRDSGATQIRLEAEDVHVWEFDGVAVATFHIRDDDLCRRTLVLRSFQGRWLIEHLHASNAPLPEEA
jgi:ketosteroid isomerase-like protein